MTAGESMELELLLAERQIEGVLTAYCQGVDRRDWDRVRACYHDGAQDSHGAFVGDADELVAWLRGRHETVMSSMHVLTNVSIRFSDDRHMARAESYCVSLQMVDATDGDPFAGQGDGPVFMAVGCRYIDTFEYQRTAGWRIRRRDVAFEWMRREGTENFLPLDPSWTRSRRDAVDPLYAPWPTTASSDDGR